MCPAGISRRRLPDAKLEGGAAQIERQVEAECGCLDEADHARDALLVVAVRTDQGGARETVLQGAYQQVGIIADQDRSHALVARCDQNRAQRALGDGKADRLVGASGAISGRGHAEHGGRLFVEAAARVEAGIVDRLGHAGASAQPVAHAGGTVRRRILARRDTGGRFEQPVEIAGTELHCAGQGGKRERLAALLDHPAGLGDDAGILRLQRGSVRIAAPAGPHAAGPRRLHRFVQADIVAIGGA